MTDTPTLVPDGISHDPDLSALSADDRLRHHAKQLRAIAFYKGADGVSEYKATYPEARQIFTPIRAGASLPKPSGYYPAWRRLAGLWLTDDAALARTLGQDVDWLNTEIGSGRLDRGRFLSKPISATERKHAAEVFADQGTPLPDTVRTKADVKNAAKAARAQAQPGAMPFGSVGTLTGDTLTIGQRTFTVQRLKGREFIRPRIDGTKRRLYLDEVEWLANLLTGSAGETTGGTPPYSTLCRDGERATSEDSAPLGPMEVEPETSSPGEWATSPRMDLADPVGITAELSLAERIRALAQRSPEPPATPDGSDPLAVI